MEQYRLEHKIKFIRALSDIKYKNKRGYKLEKCDICHFYCSIEDDCLSCGRGFCRKCHDNYRMDDCGDVVVCCECNDMKTRDCKY